MAERLRGAKILMTADAMGGVWPYALLLSRMLAARGARITLATMGELPRPEQRAEVAAMEGVELAESAFKLEWMDDPWDDVAKASEWLLSLADRARPDLVHLNAYSHAALPWRAPVVVVAHSCVLSWWRAVLREEAPERYDTYRARVRRGIHAAQAVVAPTSAMLESVRRDYGRPAFSTVIPNALATRGFAPAEKEPFIFSAGRLWDLAKNAVALCRVAPRVRWPVVVAGAQAGPSGHASIPPTVRALGWIDREALAGWLSRAAIYAWPARYEPFGLSVLEAALSGCALVLGGLPSLREVWGDAAIYVDPFDDEELERALSTLIADERVRRELGRRARARALQYTPGRMEDGYVDLYSGLLRAIPADTRGREERCG